MSDGKDIDSGTDAAKGRLSLRPAGRLELGRTVDAGSVKQSFSHGRTKTVQVEVRKSRPGAAVPGRPITPPVIAPGRPAAPATPPATQTAAPVTTATAAPAAAPRAPTPQTGQRPSGGAARSPAGGRALTQSELATRQRVLAEQVKESARRDAERREQETIMIRSAAEEARRREEEARRAAEDEARFAAEEARRPPAAEAQSAAASQATTGAEPRAAAPSRAPAAATRAPGAARPAAPAAPTQTLRLGGREGEDDDRPRRTAGGLPIRRAPTPAAPKRTGDRRGGGRIDVNAAIEGEDEKTRSLASVRRQRERERRQAELALLRSDQVRHVRDVILPDAITVQELANRMATRAGDVIKALMKLGVMATITQTLDADTAELVVQEFGHRARRVSESDVEQGIEGEIDADTDLETRPPVVTVMGHVDHGKTSLLDALRATDVAGGEAGGITQHIGAYQVTLKSGQKITFIDTPGHEAFTSMRSRGASVTDIVILVVAADDGVMPQTIEAIKHAKAANAPIIVAINKCDLPTANPGRVRQELLQHDIQTEDMGGDVLSVEISAKTRKGLDKLEEAILLQAEILDLKANPNRSAEGAVIEAKLERGRGAVATVLVRRGTLRVGAIFVAGSEWGKVRALIDDRGQTIQMATPAMPVEVIGLNAAPSAGDELMVVEDEAKAREITEFRMRRKRTVAAAASQRGSLEQMMEGIKAGAIKEMAVLIKGDVHGSVEAIKNALVKLTFENTEVRVRALDAAVGAITESDVTLAKASKAMIIGFNVRANTQARDMAKRDGVEIRYYSIIYNVIDDVKQALTGMLAPTLREKFLGNAQILQVFNITKVGKVAGCKVVEGIVKRGAKVRLLRDNVVIHEGMLKTLKRMKDEVKEVREGFECGMAFENYDNIEANDVIECFEMEEIARAL